MKTRRNAEKETQLVHASLKHMDKTRGILKGKTEKKPLTKPRHRPATFRSTPLLSHPHYAPVRPSRKLDKSFRGVTIFTQHEYLEKAGWTPVKLLSSPFKDDDGTIHYFSNPTRLQGPTSDLAKNSAILYFWINKPTNSILVDASAFKYLAANSKQYGLRRQTFDKQAELLLQQLLASNHYRLYVMVTEDYSSFKGAKLNNKKAMTREGSNHILLAAVVQNKMYIIDTDFIPSGEVFTSSSKKVSRTRINDRQKKLHASLAKYFGKLISTPLKPVPVTYAYEWTKLNFCVVISLLSLEAMIRGFPVDALDFSVSCKVQKLFLQKLGLDEHHSKWTETDSAELEGTLFSISVFHETNWDFNKIKLGFNVKKEKPIIYGAPLNSPPPQLKTTAGIPPRIYPRKKDYRIKVVVRKHTNYAKFGKGAFRFDRNPSIKPRTAQKPLTGSGVHQSLKNK